MTTGSEDSGASSREARRLHVEGLLRERGPLSGLGLEPDVFAPLLDAGLGVSLRGPTGGEEARRVSWVVDVVGPTGPVPVRLVRRQELVLSGQGPFEPPGEEVWADCFLVQVRHSRGTWITANYRTGALRAFRDLAATGAEQAAGAALP